jgi:UDP-3-O-[3-hydroxymyristoyl] N-acetylglucosamine deacetylase
MNVTIEKSGIGLHSGMQTQVRILPANKGEGRYFVRVDLPGKPVIPARIEFVGQTLLSTELIQKGASVRTVEHLLGALAASGVVDACIEIDGPEVPLLDGSAHIWTAAIAQAGLTASPVLADFVVTEAIWIREGDTFVAALPSSELRFTYGIDFQSLAIGNQWYSWSPQSENFAEAIAPARTFGLVEQVEQLRQAGLIKGGSLENALVCDQKNWLNPPLRFANEPVRHKLLDLVGDLSLLGNFPQAHFLAYKASHKLHIQLAQAINGLLHS